MRLYEKLIKYSKKGVIPFHMPGHKRKGIIKSNLPYEIDITEIDGFDNLYNPKGILRDCLGRLSNLYGSYRSYYLVNGGTSGILSSIRSFCNINDKIIIARNSHKAVFNAVELLNLNLVVLDNDIDEYGIIKEVNVESLTECIDKNRDAKCLIITSPTYDGVLSDIRKIVKVAHSYNIPVIVDEAHGAHLFLESKSALNFGADIVLNSLHKTLPSMTQTAIMHVSNFALDKEKLSKKIEKNISIFCSSSPSYVLMSSIDECVSFLVKKGKSYYAKLKDNLELFKRETSFLKCLKIIGFNVPHNYFDFDNTKLVIASTNTNISGMQLMKRLRKHNIECEMANLNSVVCLTSICDSKKDFLSLARALKDIDTRLKLKQRKEANYVMPKIKSELSIYNASLLNKKLVDIDRGVNEISGEFVYAYPPGIPLIIPGQKITSEIINYIKVLKSNKIELISTSGEIDNRRLQVLDKGTK